MNARLILLVAVVVSAAFGAAPVSAEDHAPAAPAAEHAPAAGHDGKHLAKESPVDVRTETGLWTIAVFGLLLTALYGAGIPQQIIAGLKKREEHIRSARDEALAAKAEAEKVRAELQAKMSEAHGQIAAMLDEARKDAAKVAEDIRTRAAADAAAEKERLHRDLDAAKEQAMADLYRVAVQLATAAAGKAIGRELAMSPDDQRRLVDEAIVDLQTRKGAVA